MTEKSNNEDRPPFVDPNAEYVVCHFCNRTLEPEEADGFDLSREEDYYPNMVPCCPEHGAGVSLMGVSNRPCPFCEDGVTVFDEVASKCHNCGWHECSGPVIIYGTPRCPECEEPL